VLSGSLFGESQVSEAQASWWQPTPEAPIHWQWQLSDTFNTSTDFIPNVTVYDIDGFDNSASVVSAIHSKGAIAVAYFSFGTYENWRPDANQFPSSVLGNSNGWSGEKYLDIRSSTVRAIMAARMDLAKSKGFDAIEPDNIDGYTNGTGFPLTAQDQLEYNIWIAQTAHQKGLSVGLKNDIDQISALQPYFDWVLSEESYKYSEYQGLSVFTDNNKAVFEVEYGTGIPQAVTMNSMRINSMTRDLDLVSPRSSSYVRIPCIPDTQSTWTGDYVSPTGDFSLSASPGTLSFTSGGSSTFSVSITPTGGFADAITLTLDSTPSGLTVTPGSVSNLSPDSTTTFTVESNTAGEYVVNIRGTNGTLTHTASVSVTVNAPSTQALSVSVSTDSSRYEVGRTVTSTVTVRSSGSRVANAAVSISIRDESGTVVYSGSGTTNSRGTASFNWSTRGASSGTYTVTVTASKSGYVSGSDSTSFTIR
jgi:hypothetical protein